MHSPLLAPSTQETAPPLSHLKTGSRPSAEATISITCTTSFLPDAGVLASLEALQGHGPGAPLLQGSCWRAHGGIQKQVSSPCRFPAASLQLPWVQAASHQEVP